MKYCLAVCIWAVGIAFAADTPPDWVRWFADDFEDGTARGWRIWGINTNTLPPGSWKVVKDGDNSVFADQLEFFARPKTVRGSDFRLKAKVRVIRGALNAAVRDGRPLFFVSMWSDRLELIRISTSGSQTTLRAVREPHPADRWYVLEIVAIGPQTRVYLDNELKIDYTDPESVLFSNMMLWTPGNSSVQVDDVEVTGPPLSATRLQVADLELPRAVAGAPYKHSLTAIGGTSPYQWARLEGSSLPAGLSLSAEGTISGTVGKSGDYPLYVAVTDARGERATEGLEVEVENSAITTTPVLPVATVGLFYNVQLEGAKLPRGCQWLAAELPPGLTLDPASGVLSGVPALAGNYRILTFCFGGDDIPDKTLGLFVKERDPQPLRITTRPEDLPGIEIKSYATGVLISAAGGTPPYSWSVKSGQLPAGTRLLSGSLAPLGATPFQAFIGGYPISLGKYRFTAEVADSAGATASQEFEARTTWMNIDGDDYDDVMLVTMGEPFSTQLRADGAVGAYKFAPVALPAGLSLTPEGKLSGAPKECGFLPFSAEVTESGASPVTHRFGAEFITLCAPNSFAMVSIYAPSEITGAKLNEPFQYPIGLGYGTGKGYLWRVSGGALPPGLKLTDGPLPGVVLISGTPTEAGAFEFEFRVNDDGGNLGVRVLRIVVR
jgi:hypothetical protein